MTHWKKLTNPNYLGSFSLEDRRDMILTVDHVAQETVTGPDGKREECMVLHWQEDALPMILNITNARMIEKLLKSPYVEEWSGKRVQLGAERVRAFGEIVDALRVRPFLPAEQEILCEQCGKAIIGGHGMSAQQLADYTRAKYKRRLCEKCATQEAGKK